MPGSRTHPALRGLAAVAAVVVSLLACSSGSNSDDAAKEAGTTDSTESASAAAESAGCGSSTMSDPPVTATDEQGAVTVTVSTPAGDRYWYQHVPTDYDGTEPWPLVVDFHGYAEGAALQREVSGFEALGDQEHFITVSPQGQGSPVHWDTRLDSADLKFVGQVLDTVEQTLCVDTRQVFVAGYSNGAFLASTVVCQYADRVAAIGAVAGLRDVPDCDPERPVPIVAFHGTDDEFVEYDGGMGPKAAAMPAPDGSGLTLGESPGANSTIAPGSMDQAVPDILAAWAGRNDCDTEPTDTEASSDTTLIGFSCPDGAEVELYRSDGAGHDWPGSEMSESFGPMVGKTTFTVDATELMWAFFRAHPLP